MIESLKQYPSMEPVGQDQSPSIFTNSGGNLSRPGKMDRNLQWAIKLAIKDKEIVLLRKERDKRAIELIAINKTLYLRNSDKRKRAAELVIANRELAYQNTEKEKRASELLMANLFLENLINHANAPIIVWNPEYRITRFNHAFESLTGHNETEVLGHSIEMLFPPEAVADSMALIRRTSATEGLETDEIRIMHRDGSTRTVLWNSAMLAGPDGVTPLATIAQGQDITRRKRAEEALRESEERNRVVAESAHDAIVTVDSLGCIVGWNHGAETIFGHTEAEAMGQLLAVLVPERFQAGYRAAVEALLEERGQGGAGQTLELIGLRRAGTEFPLELTLARWETSRDWFITGIIRDITERKLAETEKRTFMKHLNQIQALESLGVMVAGIAHNINNVLAIIMGTASLREQSAAGSADLDAYRTIGKACLRGRDVMRSLIQFGQPALSNQAPFELHALIEEVCSLLENTTRNRLKFIHAFFPEPLWIKGDASSFNHVLVNLCLNAMDAMSEGGVITFRTHSPVAEWLEVAVEDDGCGMAPEVLAHAVEPFFTTKEVGKGTGLGLSMSYGVAKSHGGTLELSSQLGRGTIATIRIPRIPVPGQEEPVPAPRLPLVPLNVLLVDDDPDVRFLMARMLNKAGVHQVTAVAGGEEALENLRSGTVPDLVILDQNMPGMTGVRAMVQIRQMHPGLPILISSGQPGIGDWDCFSQPKVGVISKPFGMMEIQTKLALFGASASPGS